MSKSASTKPGHGTLSYLTGPVERISGRLKVPGDKSISHRALMLGALAEGETRVSDFLSGEDCLATMAALRSMGVNIARPDATSVDITGVGLHGLRPSPGPLDMGNSGTAMRLFAGLLSGQTFNSRLIGDHSLMQRPMQRVTEPLSLMGANISAAAGGHPPLDIQGGRALQGIRYDMPIASAQVKSAVMLAGLYAAGDTSVREPAVTRDHTERMLTQFGYPVRRHDGIVTLTGGGTLQGAQVRVPADLSSAAFFLLAGTLGNEGELVLENVGLNPTRSGILEILQNMGADFRIDVTGRDDDPEPVGTITISPARLRGVEVPENLVPLAIDEFPLVFVAAALAAGKTVIRGAEELRHKESDRIGVMVQGLRALGVDVQEYPDGAVIQGGTMSGGTVDSAGDHRVAMAFTVAGIAATGPVRILDCRNVATSYPGFVEHAQSVGMQVEPQHAG